MTKTAETVRSGQIDNSKLMQAGFAQCVFILLQSVAFPELGTLGAIVAAQCALMPWAIPLVRKVPAMAVAMSLTSMVLTPAFSLLCQQVGGVLKGIIGV
ncbi:hypothetical protein [Marinobacterium aestuariivivens]|uniref:Uncharacterized protein n=1 Tax=Marinobacterium aestuariivivens TaxID=1698799 RepID=A0ABW2A9D4_9GAMM